MRALHVPAAGAPPVLSDLPTPEPGEGQVLIRVRAAGLNAVDNAIAVGSMSAMIPYEYPVILGRDAAGIVAAVGAGVDDIAVGDEVLGDVLLMPPVHAGTVAEYSVLPAAAVVPKPPELDFVSAAALPLSGAAAVAAVDAADPQPLESTLVVGASGGVGSYAVQLAADRGASVVATGTALDADRLTALGAYTVVDYTAAPLGEQVRAAYPDGVDVLIDLASRSTDTMPLDAVRGGGRVVSTLGAADEGVLAAVGMRGTNVLARPVREVVAPLAEQAAAGDLAVDVETVLPLDRAAEGLATIAAGRARGKIVVEM